MNLAPYVVPAVDSARTALAESLREVLRLPSVETITQALSFSEQLGTVYKDLCCTVQYVPWVIPPLLFILQ